MTVYNGLPYIEDAVANLINQTLVELKIVIVDDGSTDGTVDFLQSLSDERIEVILTKRVGRGRALNIGLLHCEGDYVAINDADDISLLDRLATQVKYLDEHAEVGILGSHSTFYNYADNTEIKHTRPLEDAEIRSAFTRGQPIQHVTVVFRKEAMLEVGGYNEDIPFLFDRDIFLRIGRNWKMHNLADYLVRVGHHEKRFFYGSYKGFQREYISLKYRIMAIQSFGFPRYYIIRECVRSIWSLLPNTFRRVIINIKKSLSK